MSSIKSPRNPSSPKPERKGMEDNEPASLLQRFLGTLASPGTLPVALVLLLATIITYANSIDGGLHVLDNKVIILRDTRLQDVTIDNLGAKLYLIFSENYWYPTLPSDLYRPVTTLTYMINYSVFGNGTEPEGYHIVNLLLHWINGVLVFLLVSVVLGRRWPGVATALLFVVHPLTTESVANVVGRADLLATMAVLSAMNLHIRAYASTGAQRLLQLIGLGVVGLIGIFCKESAVVLLGLMPLYDFTASAVGPMRTWFATLWKRTLMLGWIHYLALLPAAMIYIPVRAAVMADTPVYGQIAVDNPLVATTFIKARLTAVKVLGYYLGQLVWPETLSCDYSYNAISLYDGTLTGPGDWQVWVSLAVLLALGGAAIWGLFRFRPLFFFMMFAVIAMAPTSNLIILYGSIMAERTLYLPLVGCLAAIVSILAYVFEKYLVPRWEWSPDFSGAILTGVLMLAIIPLCIRSIYRNPAWHDEIALWGSAIEAAPNSHKVYKGMAEALIKQDPNNIAQSVELAKKGLDIYDESPLGMIHEPGQLLSDLLSYYIQMGDHVAREAGVAADQGYAGSLPWYEKALELSDRAVTADKVVNDESTKARRERGIPMSKIHDVGNPEVYRLRGTLLMRLHRWQDAAIAFNGVRRLDPGNVDAYLSIAICMFNQGQYEIAAKLLLQSLMLGSQHAESYDILESIYARLSPEPPAVKRMPDGRATINVDNPLAKRHIEESSFELVQFLLETKRYEPARMMRDRAISMYGCPPQMFEPLSKLLSTSTNSPAESDSIAWVIAAVSMIFALAVLAAWFIMAPMRAQPAGRRA